MGVLKCGSCGSTGHSLVHKENCTQEGVAQENAAGYLTYHLVAFLFCDQFPSFFFLSYSEQMKARRWSETLNLRLAVCFVSPGFFSPGKLVFIKLGLEVISCCRKTISSF